MILRPGLLRCNRIERRYIEMCAIALSNCLDVFEWWSLKTTDLAHVIVHEAIASSEECGGICSFIVLEHSDIIRCTKNII